MSLRTEKESSQWVQHYVQLAGREYLCFEFLIVLELKPVSYQLF